MACFLVREGDSKERPGRRPGNFPGVFLWYFFAISTFHKLFVHVYKNEIRIRYHNININSRLLKNIFWVFGRALLFPWQYEKLRNIE